MDARGPPKGHGTCDDSSGTPVCACDAPFAQPSCADCIPGYRFDGASDACVWDGGLADTGFDGTAWSTSGEAVVADGMATLSPDTACLGGDVSQTVTLPSSSLTGPLALVVSARHNSGFAGHLGVSVNGQWWDLGVPEAGSFADQVVCLGETYGGQGVTVTLAPTSKTCSTTANIDIDSVELQMVDESTCPTSDFIPNGDFESGNVDWQVTGDVGSGVGLDGINGGKGARVVASGAPNGLTNTIHIPSADIIAHPAIQFWNRVQPDVMGDVVALGVWLDGFTIGNFGGDPAGGTVADFEPSLNPDLRPSIIFGGLTGFGTPAVLNLASGSDAFEGTGAAVLTLGSCMSNQQVDWLGVIPDADGTGGPALTLQYRSTDLNGVAAASLSGSVGGIPYQGGAAVDPVDLASSTTWQQATLCLGADNSGKSLIGSVTFYLTGSSSCPGSDPMPQLYLDNLRVGTSASCPVN